MGRELDAQVAEKLMGFYDVSDGKNDVLFARKPEWPNRFLVPHYSSSRDAAAGVEAEIERRGLKNEYMNALWRECRPAPVAGTFVSVSPDWYLIRASAEARCRAALKAVKGDK